MSLRMLLLGYILDGQTSDTDAVQMYRKAAASRIRRGRSWPGGDAGGGQGRSNDPTQAVRHVTKAAARRGNAVAIECAGPGLHQRHAGPHAGTSATTRRRSPRSSAAAQQGYVPAAAELGRAYRDGDYGLAPDPVPGRALAGPGRGLRKQRAAPEARSDPRPERDPARGLCCPGAGAAQRATRPTRTAAPSCTTSTAPAATAATGVPVMPGAPELLAPHGLLQARPRAARHRHPQRQRRRCRPTSGLLRTARSSTSWPT